MELIISSIEVSANGSNVDITDHGPWKNLTRYLMNIVEVNGRDAIWDQLIAKRREELAQFGVDEYDIFTTSVIFPSLEQYTAFVLKWS